MSSWTFDALGSTENQINKDKYGENVPHLEIDKVSNIRPLWHC